MPVLGKLSPHLSYKEATKSVTAKRKSLKNEPNLRQFMVMKNLAEGLFEPIREHFGVPLYVSSFFRSKALNSIISNASKNSDHMILGDTAAIDLDQDVFPQYGVTNADIFYYVYDNLDYETMIWEHGDDEQPYWVHISYSTDPEKNKLKKTLRARIVEARGQEYIIFEDKRNKYEVS